MHFTAVKKSSKRSGFVTRMQFTRGVQSFKLVMSNGVPFVNRRYTKGVPFQSKWYKRVRVGP